jgi:hypothetical protein
MGHSAGHDIDPTFYRSPATAISAPPEHHFGWHACSNAFAHAGHDTDGLQRRYLLLPVVIMVRRGGDAPANLQSCQSTFRDSQPCSATWASQAR